MPPPLPRWDLRKPTLAWPVVLIIASMVFSLLLVGEGYVMREGLRRAFASPHTYLLGILDSDVHEEISRAPDTELAIRRVADKGRAMCSVARLAYPVTLFGSFVFLSIAACYIHRIAIESRVMVGVAFILLVFCTWVSWL